MLMLNKLKAVLFALCLVLPLPVYAADNAPGASSSNADENGVMGKLKGFVKSFKDNDGYLDLGLRTGYMYGQNTFDFDHHTSELEYPMRAYMGGGNITLGYKDLSINMEAWGSLMDDPTSGWHMKDKDWNDSGQMFSYTKSSSDMNAVIWDGSLRYDFFKHSFGQKAASDQANKLNLKLGALIGYRYERFGYKIFGLYEAGGTGTYGSGSEVAEYKVKYRLPYYGLAAEVYNRKFGISVIGKYGFCGHAEDMDNHLLHSRTNYGDYDGNPNVFMSNIVMFWNFHKNWEAKLGADITLIRINGQSWDENHDPDWNKDQNIDTKQFIYWIGLGYKF